MPSLPTRVLLQRWRQHKQQQQQQQPGDAQHQQQHAQVAALQERASKAEAELQAATAQLASLQQNLAAAEQRAAYAAAEAQQFRAAAAAARSSARPDASGAAALAVAGSDDDALQEQVELLMRKVIALKKSRDKLLAQMDRQSVELEQMSLDSQALAAAATQARAEGDQWRSQAQDALLTISQLQEMLAEGASWEASAAAAADAPNGTDQGSSRQAAGLQDSSSGEAHAAADAGAVPASSPAKLRAALLQEQARNAALDVQVRVLSAQLVRAQAAYQGAARSLLPILGGVEARLLALQARSAPRAK